MTAWILGMDLRRTSAGALRYCAWLHARGGGSVSLHAIHVVEEIDQHHAIRLGLHSRARLLTLTRETTTAALRHAGIEDCFEKIEVLPGGAADPILDQQRAERGANAVLIGRQGPVREGFPPRLGRVARRMLRHAEGPVIVVPPDLDEAILEGPVVLATDAGPSSVAAAHFAHARARQWGRPLRVVHILRPTDTGGLSFLPRSATEGARQVHYRQQKVALEAWVVEQGLGEVELDLRSGSSIDELLAVARQGSPLLVCGARRLSWVKRHLEASHATTLSSYAPVPVAVVPPSADVSDSPE